MGHSLASLGWKSAVTYVLGVLVGLIAGCSEGPGGEHVENQPPTVWLAGAPPSGSDSSYRVHFYWGGWDPDGNVAYYEYAITDNENGAFDPADTLGADKWHRVYGNDSTLTFSADQLADPDTEDIVSRFERSHTFFVRAVDEYGLASREAAYRSFTAWTLSPRAYITLPRKTGLIPAQVPGVSTFRWVASDYVTDMQESILPDSVRWILHAVEGKDYAAGVAYIRENPQSGEWSPWTEYGAAEDADMEWTTPTLDPGGYVFGVQAKDEAGAVTPVFDERYNVRRINVSTHLIGPTLEVYNEYIGTVRTTTTRTPPAIIDMPAGLPVAFSWSADADYFGGVVSGYRYGWDIADLDDPELWEVDYTPFTGPTAESPVRSFYFGSHTFTVEVISNSGARSRVEAKINIVPWTMSSNLLLVDDFDVASKGIDLTNGQTPNDDEHDAFWEEMLADVAGFSMQSDAIEVTPNHELSIVTIARYKCIIWDVYGAFDIRDHLRPKLWELIRFRSKDPARRSAAGKIQINLLVPFLKAGGRLMLCGRQPMTQVIVYNDLFQRKVVKYPFVFRYELEGDQDGNYTDQVRNGNFVGDQSFAYRDACVNVLDIATATRQILRTAVENGCGASQLDVPDPIVNGLRELLPIDPSYPPLELRSEVADPGRNYAPDRGGLNAELYNPPYFADCRFSGIGERSCFEPVYGHGAGDPNSPLHNAPVGFWSSVYRDIIPDNGIARPARSFFLGVEPYYFEPAHAKAMIEKVVFDEWGLPRR